MLELIWIIDGNNLIRRDPDLAALERHRGLDVACRTLEGQLGIFHHREGRGHQVVLVYDGAPRPGQAPAARRKGFRVLYPEPGRDADQVVLSEVRRAEGLRRVRVVTSDRRDIGNRLRGLGVEWWSVEEFRKVLWRGQSASASRVEEKPKAPRGQEVDFWMDAFGEEEPDE